ncbi:hypothetical protein PHLGIDRAFT_122810 [Phlebiopsis gigantea 11061_1 CR5-6]|uniref:Peptidase A1 domain-containing protein n=1 Tax=Phlebiopsis gigantea (strain 11061_1 CR5-6) TaxID=745531 RepID=A0A0C3RZT3_PHLG1|nr:hypothetical protein PHLGIDRAFT_122810 [Phlebiopsis gigantea 11061_1 CR5-6]
MMSILGYVFLAIALIVAAKPAVNTGVNIPLTQRSSLTPLTVLSTMKEPCCITFAVTTNTSIISVIFLQIRESFPKAGKSRTSVRPPPLTPNVPRDLQSDASWAGDISIGTAAQGFRMDFATGSYDLLVPNSSCQACANKNIYGPAASSTSTLLPFDSFEIAYADGSSTSGPVYTDSVAGLTATQQIFSAFTNTSSSFGAILIDGILCLAWPDLANLNGLPFFNTLVFQGVVNEGVFAFKLAAQYLDPIEFHGIDPSAGHWQVPGATAGSATPNSGFATIIDSGTTLA